MIYKILLPLSFNIENGFTFPFSTPKIFYKDSSLAILILPGVCPINFQNYFPTFVSDFEIT